MHKILTFFLGEGGGGGVESDFGRQCYTQFSLKRQQKHFEIAIKKNKNFGVQQI